MGRALVGALSLATLLYFLLGLVLGLVQKRRRQDNWASTIVSIALWGLVWPLLLPLSLAEPRTNSHTRDVQALLTRARSELAAERRRLDKVSQLRRQLAESTAPPPDAEMVARVNSMAQVKERSIQKLEALIQEIDVAHQLSDLHGEVEDQTLGEDLQDKIIDLTAHLEAGVMPPPDGPRTHEWPYA